MNRLLALLKLNPRRVLLLVLLAVAALSFLASCATFDAPAAGEDSRGYVWTERKWPALPAKWIPVESYQELLDRCKPPASLAIGACAERRYDLKLCIVWYWQPPDQYLEWHEAKKHCEEGRDHQ
jgi:hypothetical protein